MTIDSIRIEPPPTLTPDPCPVCHAYEWWVKPDGGRLCGNCVRRAGTRGGDS
jgi:hypothetical protein